MSLEGKSTEEIERLAKWADGVLSSEHRKEALLLTKKINPAFKSPELEIDERIEKATATIRDENKALRDQMQSDIITREREAKKAELAAKGYDIVAVEKVMQDNGVSNYEAAVKLMKAEAILAPAAPSPHRGAFGEAGVDFKDVAKNPKEWANKKAHDVVDEILRARA